MVIFNKNIRKSLLGLFILNLFIKLISGSLIGIDIGSSTFKVVLVKPGSIDIVENDVSARKTFTAISISPHGRFFGEQALKLYAKSPENVYNNLMQLFGLSKDFENTKWFSELKQLREIFYLKNIISHTDGMVVRVGGNDMFIEELFGQILSKARDYSSDAAKTNVVDAILTVPNYWTHIQRKVLLQAAKLGGLKVSGLINENAAIAIKYAVDRNFDSSQIVLFYDMGFSDTQVSVFRFRSDQDKNAKYPIPRVNILSQVWDEEIGGINFDRRIVLHWISQLKKEFGEELILSDGAMAKLLLNAKKAKEILSANKDVRIVIEYLLPEYDFKCHLTRETFEGLCEDLFERAVKLVPQALEKAGITLEELSYFELFGGAVRIPKLQEVLKKMISPMPLSRHLNSDEAAAFGAAIYGATLSSQYHVKKMMIKGVSSSSHEIIFKITDEEGLPVNELIQKGHKEALELIKSGNFEKAFSYLESFTDSEHTNSLKGLSKLLLREYQEALVYLRNAVEFNLNNLEAWVNLGIAQLELDQLKDALSTLRKSLNLRPNYEPAVLAKVATLLKMNDSNEIYNFIGTNIINNSTTISAYLKGLLYLFKNNLEEALTSFDSLLKINPNHLDAHIGRCLVLERLGKMKSESCPILENPSPFFWNNHTVAIPALEHQDFETLFVEKNNLGNKRILRAFVTKNILLKLSYGKNSKISDHISSEIGTYLISWPREALNNLNISKLPMVSIYVELTRSGILKVHGAESKVYYYEKNFVQHSEDNPKVKPDDVSEESSDSQESQPEQNSEEKASQENEKVQDQESHQTKNQDLNKPGDYEYNLKNINIRMEIKLLNRIGLSEEQFKSASERISEINSKEKLVRETESAKSDLESLIYNIYQMNENPTFIIHSTEKERSEIISQADHEQEWLSGEGENSNKISYQEHINSIKSKLDIINLRISEEEDFPNSVTKCMESLKIMRLQLGYVNLTRNITETDLYEAEEMFNQTESYLKKANESFSNKLPNTDLEVTSKEISKKCKQCSRKLDILNMLPKRKIPKPSPAENEKEAKNGKSSATSDDSGTPKNNSTGNTQPEDEL